MLWAHSNTVTGSALTSANWSTLSTYLTQQKAAIVQHKIKLTDLETDLSL